MRSATPSEAFSTVAPDYDRAFGTLRPVPELRQRVIGLVTRHAAPGGRLLEIGSGTGEDAQTLIAAGFDVTATDVSPGMTAEASRRLALTSGRVVTAGAEDVPALFAPGSFDAVFSNFGALNCVPDLPEVLPRLARLLKPGGTMVVCLLGKYSLWEMAAGIGRFRFRDAFRRISHAAVNARVGPYMVPVWYHSITAMRGACKGWGDIIAVEGLNVLSPPPHALAFPRHFPRLASLLDHIDRRASTRTLLRAFGDHTVFVIRTAQNGQARSHDR